jgi:cytolysin-activating lysine-acyltransferase
MTNTSDQETIKKYTAGISIPKMKMPKVEIPDQLKSFSDTTKKTFSTIMGEIVWLLTQSSVHKHLALSDLEWMIMPPIMLNQFKVYHNEDQPVGVALWGYLSPEAEQRLQAVSRIAPQDWGNGASLDEENGLVAKEGGTLWLIEIISPFNDEKNNHQQQMLADLIETSLKGQKFKIMRINPETGVKEIATLG